MWARGPARLPLRSPACSKPRPTQRNKHMGKREAPNESGEAFLKSRRAGAEGTRGASRKGVAEKTVIGHGDQRDSGSLDPELGKAASGAYQAAVHNRGDRYGDKALTER